MSLKLKLQKKKKKLSKFYLIGIIKLICSGTRGNTSQDGVKRYRNVECKNEAVRGSYKMKRWPNGV